MLERYSHDLNYLKARHAERLREIGIGGDQSQKGLHGVRERLFSTLGDVLIIWGQKLKGEMEVKKLSGDCA